VGFMVDEVALGQVFSEYFGFPCQSSFQPDKCLTIISPENGNISNFRKVVFSQNIEDTSEIHRTDFGMSSKKFLSYKDSLISREFSALSRDI
jgi:hypothetical protein